MRYMDAWKRTDLDALAALLKEDAQLTMPPTPGWFFGRDAILRFYARYPFRVGASEHLHTPTRANRQPAHAVWRRGQPGGPAEAVWVDGLPLRGRRNPGIHHLLQPGRI